MSALPAAVANSPQLPALSPAAAKAMDVTPQEIIRRWLASVSDSARRGYSRSLREFTTWAMPTSQHPEDGLRLLCTVGAGKAHQTVTEWRDALLERGLAPGSAACAVSALASLMRCCRRAGLTSFVIEGVAPKRERVQDRRGPSRGDVERLVGYLDELASVKNTRAIRDAAIVRMLYVAGMRRAEVVGLRLQDVNLHAPDGPTVYPRRKGARTRQPLTVSKRTGEAIQRWLDVRGDAPGALFHRLDRPDDYGHMRGEAIRRMLKARARQAGIKAAVRPHGLRHSVATETARRGSLAELQAVGGWRSLSAASAYLDERTETRRRAMEMIDL